MPSEPRQHMAAVLPHRLGHHERRGGIDRTKDLDAVRLTVDEAVSLGGVYRVSAHDASAECGEGGSDRGLELGLRRPAHLVGGESRVAAGDEDDVAVGHGCGYDRPLPMGYASLTFTGKRPLGLSSPFTARMNDEK